MKPNGNIHNYVFNRLCNLLKVTAFTLIYRFELNYSPKIILLRL